MTVAESGWLSVLLEHAADWSVASFTALLVYVTYRLVKTTGDLRASTDKLWEAGERQIKVAEQAAAAARQSAEVAERALVLSTRATVFHSKIHQVAGLSQKAGLAVTDWTFFIIWENTGTTPTRHLAMHTNWQAFDGDIPADFAFHDRSAVADRPKMMIGPKSTTWSSGLEIPIAILIDALEKRRRLLLWGWVEYNDVFDPQTRHRTECAVEILVVGDPRVAHAPGDMSTPNNPFHYRGGFKFSGMDDECLYGPVTSAPS